MSLPEFEGYLFVISSIRGVVEDVGDGFAILRVDGISYQVFIPQSLARKLKEGLGSQVQLFTVHYLEGFGRFGNPVPRLVGFETELDREFFEKLITVSDVGARRALRALTMPIREISEAIETEDLASLKRMKGIGEKTAKKIVAELKGQMGKYALMTRGDVLEGESFHSDGEMKELATRALVNLGYNKVEAVKMVDRVWGAGTYSSVEDVIREIYSRQKTKR